MVERDGTADAAAGAAAGPPEREVFVGGVNEVVREGAAVRRPAGPWSATVQRLLGHLAAEGFEGAPAPLGLSEDGREEAVEYLPGEVGHDFGAPQVRSDASLVAVARLLRRLHDASATFRRTPEDVWNLPIREPAEVICHGDAATYNTVFRDGVPVAFIDFDTAHPAPRIWDAAYTAYRFVPLYAPDEVQLTQPVAEARRRLSLFAQAYGLSEGERAALPGVAAQRLRAHVALMRSQAAAGNAAFARHIAEGDDRRYLTDAGWIERVYGGTLRTERLTLRPVRAGDEAWLLGHWTEPRVRRFLFDGEVLTPDQVRAEIADSVRRFAADGYGLWLIQSAAETGHEEQHAQTAARAEIVQSAAEGEPSAEAESPDQPDPCAVRASADQPEPCAEGASADQPDRSAEAESSEKAEHAEQPERGENAEHPAVAEPAGTTAPAAGAAVAPSSGAAVVAPAPGATVGHGTGAVFAHEAGTSGGARAHALGTVGIRPLHDLGLELWYSLDPAAWGNGYAAEAARVLLDHALGPLGLPELLAEVDEGNRASAALVTKLGMEPFDVVPGVLGPMTRYRTAKRPATT